MARSRKYELGVGVLLLGALVVLGWMALQVGAFSGFGDRVEVQVRLRDAAGLQEGAQVAVAGVPVGTVTGLRVEHDLAIVDLALDPAAGIRADATAQVRARSVLGEKYVEIVPRSREFRLARDGDVLASGREQTEIDEMVSAMGPIVAAVDPERVARLIEALSAAVEDDPERLTRMLANLDTLLAQGAAASRDLPDLVSEGRQTLAQARGTLRLVDARAAQLEGMLDQADGILDQVEGATDDLPALADDVAGVVSETRSLVATLAGSTDELEVILDNLGEIDKWEIRRLLREEGILVRLRPRRVVEEEPASWQRRGSVE